MVVSPEKYVLLEFIEVNSAGEYHASMMYKLLRVISSALRSQIVFQIVLARTSHKVSAVAPDMPALASLRLVDLLDVVQ